MSNENLIELCELWGVAGEVGGRRVEEVESDQSFVTF